MEPVNVQAIKIMIKTNIPGQKDIPFTNALLYHPDLSSTGEYNEYPYISDNIVIPNSLVQSLKSGKYNDIADFFFNKKVFLSRLEANKADVDSETKEVKDAAAAKAAADKAAANAKAADATKAVADDKAAANSTSQCAKTEEEEDEILQKNIMTMLNLLFPTVIPVSDNVKDSYSTFINPDKSGSGLKLSMNSVKEWFSYFKFSFLKIDGKEYTVNRIVWLNDVMNHPTYSGLIEEFTEYKAWSAQTKTKLLKEKKDIYERIIRACVNELRPDDMKKEQVPNKDKFSEDGIFQDTYKRLNIEYIRYGGKDVISNKAEEDNQKPIYVGDKSNTLNIIRLLSQLKDDIIPDLAKAAWFIKKNSEKVDLPPILATKNESRNGIQIQNDYIDFKSTTQPNDIPTIQKYIENLGLDNLKSSYEELNKPTLFSEKFKVFYSNLTKLYERNRIIQSIIGRLDNTEYDKTPIPGEYSKITSMMKSLSDNESTNRESTNKCFQDIIDSYVAVKNTPKTETTETTPKTITAPDLEKLKENISVFKKDPKGKKDFLDTFYVGITQLNNNDALKAPSFEIYILVDVVGGVLDVSNIKKAKCMYKDKKLTKDFYNIRQKLIESKWKVTPGQFFNVSDIGNNKIPLRKTVKKPNPKTIMQPPMRHGGHRTRKIRRR